MAFLQLATAPYGGPVTEGLAVGAAPVAYVVRSGVVESVHHGHVVGLAAMARAPSSPSATPTSPSSPARRSSRSRPSPCCGRVLDLSGELLALAAASHSGEPAHLDGVHRILAGAALRTYGVPVDRAGPAYAELALLRGDPSDGLPGVPGVGEKTAATLLAQHGSLEDILAAAHDPKSKMSKAYRTKLLAATDYIEAAGPVVRVATDADVNFSTPTDALPLAAEHPRKVAELAEQYGVTSSIGRLQKALDALPGSAERAATSAGRPRRCRCRPGTSPSPALGAVDADLAVEGVALLHGRALRRCCT